MRWRGRSVLGLGASPDSSRRPDRQRSPRLRHPSGQPAPVEHHRGRSSVLRPVALGRGRPAVWRAALSALFARRETARRGGRTRPVSGHAADRRDYPAARGPDRECARPDAGEIRARSGARRLGPEEDGLRSLLGDAERRRLFDPAEPLPRVPDRHQARRDRRARMAVPDDGRGPHGRRDPWRPDGCGRLARGGGMGREGEPGGAYHRRRFQEARRPRSRPYARARGMGGSRG